MLKKYLSFIAKLSVNHTWKILVGIMILTLILGYQASSLRLQISFDYLLPDTNPRIKTLNHILDAFENDSNILLLATGSEDSLKSFAYHIKPLLESFDEWVSGVHTHTPVEFLRKNSLKLMDLDELNNFGDIFYDPNLVPFLFNLNNAFENTYLHSNKEIISHWDEQDVVDFLDKIQIFIKAQEEIMSETEAVDVGQKVVDAIIFGESLKFSLDRHMLLIIIEPGFNMHLTAKKLIRNVNGIEEIINNTAIQQGIKTEMTGPIVKARDNYTAILAGFWRISMLLLGSIALILFLSFRFCMWSIPLMCISTLIVGIIWTLGIYSFFMQTINLISILALMIYIFLGLGNCILIILGCLEKRKHGLNIVVSIQETLQRLGSGVLVGGGVVGLTFLSLILSEIKVCQDLGIMVGIGIITITLVTIILLPSMLFLQDKLYRNTNLLNPPRDISYPFLGKGAQYIAKYRWVSIIFIFLLTGFIMHQGMQIYTNTSISNLDSYDASNIHSEDELIKYFGMPSSILCFAIDNLETARIIMEQARDIISNGWVESITDYLPDEGFNDEKFRYLRELRREIKSREVRKLLSSHDMKLYRKEIERLEANIIELQNFSLLTDKIGVYDKTIQLVGDGIDSSFQGILSPFINAMDTGMNRLKLTYLQEQFSSTFKSTVLEMANTEPLTLHTLPLDIKDRFMGGEDNLFRINIYPDNNIWDDPLLFSRFLEESLSIKEKITGWPIIFIELKDRITSYGFQSIRLLLVSMMLLLILGLRSLKYSLIIMTSIVTGFIWLMGLFIFFNIPFNLMSIWIIPIMLSLGMHNGVQIIQRWKLEKNLDTVYRSTGKAILITMITIFVMELPFWFVDHTVSSSIASILLAGLGCNFLSLIIIIPTLLGDETPR